MGRFFEASPRNIREIVINNLCIGCGLCSVACPNSAIHMVWQERRIWTPIIDNSRCIHCGCCYKVCPHTPQCIGEYASAALAQGVRFGLPPSGTYFITYDMDETKRIRSASGGVTSVLLEHLLVSKEIDGVVASLPVTGMVGEPHFQMHIFRSPEDLDRGRNSHYHPLCYDRVLNELKKCDGLFAVVGVPCVLRGIVRLPMGIKRKIKYKICLVCGKNVTGAFTDCLAAKEGIAKDVTWQTVFRDKVGIPNANNYNNLFQLPDRVVRRNRFASAFTDMWRNYFFAQECCLYCPDFYGVDADMSVKDAWGRLSADPLGTSLVIVNNDEIEDHLVGLRENKCLVLQKCDADEVFNSQISTPIFKHQKIRNRLVWKKNIKQELDRNYSSLELRRHWFSHESHEYWRLWSLIKLSNFFYFRFGKVPVEFLLFLVSPGQKARLGLRKLLKKRKSVR